jgi:histidyl-tRNA synthetase
MRFRAVRGMNDILPAEAPQWRRLEAAFRARAELHGFGEVRTPILEATALFAKQMGETSDVVEKEMYSFDRHGDELTVRPEGTAGAARAYVEHGLGNKEPVTRWYYLGPMFRGERPAKGRYRQFWQAGCEVFGDPGPIVDADTIELVCAVLRDLGIRDVSVHVNSLGGGDTRARFRDALVAWFEPRRASLSEDSQRRLEKNPLRILDSKDPRDQEAAKGAPSILEVLTAEDRAHFEGVKAHLRAIDVPFVEDPSLVRGLDYYTRTLFEVKALGGDLGAQNTVCGGGRYDDMVESLGGAKTPAFGFAMGLERLLTLMPPAAEPEPAPVYVLPVVESDEGAELVTTAAMRVTRSLREARLRTELEGRRVRLKTALSRAEKLGARWAVIVGTKEAERGVVALKDLARREQHEVAAGDVAAFVARAAPSQGAP